MNEKLKKSQQSISSQIAKKKYVGQKKIIKELVLFEL